MKKLLHAEHPFRIFAISAFVTLTGIFGVLGFSGPSAALVILILIAVEIAFSFDNAIINAKTLTKLSDTWQRLFLTVGMIVAVLGMRVIFPILIVSLTAHLSWGTVLDLAFNHPHEYATKLEAAHPAIAAYGGAFLLMLALEFFIDNRRKVLWLKYVERPLQRLSHLWAPVLISVAAVLLISVAPGNHHASTTIFAGLLGIVTHIAIGLFTNLFGSKQRGNKIKNTAPLTGMAAFSTFIYLEILDASFSFDGVIGAFAITTDVVLISIGLGIGALWVRSLTVFMVKKGTLSEYIYLEHGAHYTVAVLAFILLVSTFFEIPDALAGVAGFGLIGSAIFASHQALQKK